MHFFVFVFVSSWLFFVILILVYAFIVLLLFLDCQADFDVDNVQRRELVNVYELLLLLHNRHVLLETERGEGGEAVLGGGCGL